MSRGKKSLRKTVVAGRQVSSGTAAQIHAARKLDSGGMIDSVPPSEDAVRAAIEEGKCPFCGRGPWKMLPVHTNKVHGVDKWQLRDMAGLTTTEALCDAETRARMSRAAKRHPEAVKRATEAAGKPGVKKNPRRTVAGRQKQRDHLRQWMEANPDKVADLHSTVRNRTTTPEALVKWRASMERVWNERETTPEQRAAFVERMTSPEIEEIRRRRREETRITTCQEPGCDRPHAARGMCHMHWSRWRSKQNRRTECLHCGQPMEAQSARRKFCRSACKQRFARQAKAPR